MIRKLKTVAIMFSILLLGCQHPEDYEKRYQAAVQSGFEKIPQSLEMEKLFGEADHFITHYGLEDGPLKWNSEVYFYGRYSLTMRVKVKLTKRYGTIVKMIDKPKYTLIEVGSVNLYQNGTVGGKIASDNKFGPEEWKKLVKAKGDFSVIGLTVHKDRPIKDFDKHVKAVRDPRIRIRPSSEAKTE